MIELSIDVLFDDWPALADKLNNLPLDDIGRILITAMQTNIDLLEGPPRKEPTGDWPLLRKTDSMYNGMTFDIVSSNEVFAHPDGYAKYHVFGTSKMPARDFVFYNDQSIDEIQQVLIDHLSV